MPKIVDEEEPFRKIRLTLSEDAIEKIGTLKSEGYFRSDSMTVEECIRAIYDIVEDLKVSSGASRKKPILIDDQTASEIFGRIAIRLSRFTRITWERIRGKR